MKIGMVVENIPSGVISGGRMHAMFVACALVEIGHDVTMLTDHQPRFLSYFDPYRLPKIRRVNLRNLSSGDFDIVLTYPIVATEFGLNFAKRLDVPHWAVVLDTEPIVKKFAPAVASRMHFGPNHTKALQESDLILTISEHAVPATKRWTGNPNVIPLMGCVNSRVAEEVGTAMEPGWFVAVSRGTEHKRFNDLLYVVREAGIKLNVITSFGVGEMKRRAGGLVPQGSLNIVDKPNDGHKFELIKSAVALICPSAYEGLGIPLMEALYCGTPVICYDFPILKEVCGSGALYAGYLSPESLARKTRSLLNDPELLLNMRAQAFRAGRRFKFEALCGRLAGVIEEWT